MENVLEFGITNGIFDPTTVMNLFYGNLKYSQRKTLPTGELATFCSWDSYPHSEKNWPDIPLKQRINIISMVVKQCANGYNHNTYCFHDRILCILHDLLDDEENQLKCYCPDCTQIITYRKYELFINSETHSKAITEMFLWWHLGIRKKDEERQLLKKCWIKFLGHERPLSQKRTAELTKQKIEELKIELQKANRLVNTNRCLLNSKYHRERKEIKKHHYSGSKKAFLFSQLEKKECAADHRLWKAQASLYRCKTAIYFLNGYLESLSAIKQLKQTSNP